VLQLGLCDKVSYHSFFRPQVIRREITKNEALTLEMADETVKQMHPLLLNEAVDAVIPVIEATAGTNNFRTQDEIVTSYKLMVPADKTRGLADIAGTAWIAYETGIWKDKPKEKYVELLRDLVLKNLEVYEIEQILEETSDAEG